MLRTIRRTLSLHFDSWIAREQDVVVLPTPPFPPVKRLKSERLGVSNGKYNTTEDPFQRLLVKDVL